MRAPAIALVLVAALVATLLAGCSGNGSEGTATVSLTSAPHTASHASSSRSATSTARPGGNNGFAVQQGMVTNTTAGIVVTVQWHACEAGFCAHAVARNNGTATVHPSSICVPPWRDSMTGEQGTVQPRAGEAHCAAFGTSPFGPGAKWETNLTWDGHLYDDMQDTGPAPQGGYTWRITFWWYGDAQGAPGGESAADVQLIIGET